METGKNGDHSAALPGKASAATLRRALDAAHSQAQRAKQVAATLAEVGAAPDVESALERLLLGAISLLRGTGGTARLYDPQRGQRTLTLNVVDNGPVERDPSVRPITPGTFGAALIQGGPPTLIPDFWQLDPQRYPNFESMRARGVRSAVNVRVDSGGVALGTLDVHHHLPDFFTSADLELASALAAHAGATIARAQAEAARQDALLLHAQLLDAVGQAVVATDLEGRITYWNRAAEALYGWTAAEAVGQSAAIIVPPEARIQAESMLTRLRLGERADGEFRACRRDGSTFYVLSSATPVYQASGTLVGVVVVSADLTEQKRAQVEALVATERLRAAHEELRTAHEELRAAQEHIVQQERLRALGQMAAGIAHDLNNALSPVVGFTELLLTVPSCREDPERLDRFLNLIHTGATDAAEVVRRLREFYRPQQDIENATAVAVDDLLRQVLALTRPKWRDEAQASGRTIAVELDVPLAPLPLMAGHPAALREALINLVLNAVDASPAGGTITLRCRLEERRPEGPPAGAEPASAPAAIVVLEVADTGVGMTEEVRARCLEPFFTTKGERGTGLGLALVYGVVRRHGGAIEIETAAGAGTTVRLRLPFAAASRQAPRARGAGGPALRPLRVLVVDDEPAVREITRACLATDGHSVVVAGSGREALDAFQPGAFDLVVLDRAMPDISGEEVAGTLKHRAPQTPILLLTGFGDIMLASGQCPPGIDLVLGKPATLESLRRAVARLTQPAA